MPTTQVTCGLSRVPRTNQLEVRAWQTVPTAFAKVIGVNQAQRVNSEVWWRADLQAAAEEAVKRK